MIQIVTGDTVEITATLEEEDSNGDYQPYAIDLAWTVKLGIRYKNTPIGSWDCDSGIAGANWPSGIVVGVIPGADSVDFTAQPDIQVEVKISDSFGNKKTFIGGCGEIVLGTIT